MRHVFAGCLAVTTLLLANPASASGECGSAPAGWNAPNGAVVFSRGPGPIRDVLDAVGEYRTHSMLSHGPGAGVSHATMRTPDKNSWPTVCSLPMNATQLQYGYPGLEQINQGGIYMYIYGDGIGPEFLGYQHGDPTGAAIIADAVWYNHPYTSDLSQVDSSQYVDRPLRNGNRINYSLFQYRNLEAAHLIPSGSVNEGMVCSTFLAYAQAYAGRGTVSAYTYSHAEIANAATSLYAGIYNQCQSSFGWFEKAGLAMVCPWYNVCGNAADQVVNCMSANRCNTSDGSIWRAMRDSPSATATSISPDRVGGWGVHPIDTTQWSPDYTHSLQWNSGGNVYGCWQ
jgi:hypothetical protein